MNSLVKVALPSTIMVDGVGVSIKTDFRVWLQFSNLIKRGEVRYIDDVNFLFTSGECKSKNAEEVLKQLIGFLNPKKELPRPIGGSSDTVVLDYDIDAGLIFAAFWEQYKIDLFDPKLDLHWWKFCALLGGLHNTKLNEVMSYRSYDTNDRTDYKETMQQLKRAWEIVTPPTAEELEALAAFDNKLK